MPQRLSDPSFELGLVWSYSAQGATRVQAGAGVAFDGSWVAQLESRAGFAPFDSSLHQTVSLTPITNEPLAFRWRREVSISGHELRAFWNSGSGLNQLASFGAGPTGTWSEWQGLVSLSGPEDGRFELRAVRGAGIGTARWWIDLATLGTEDPEVLRRREIKAAVATKLGARAWTVSPAPTVLNESRAIHEMTAFPAVNVLYLEERKEVEQLSRRRGILDLALAIYARGSTAADVCDDIAGEAEAELETPTTGIWLGLAYVRLVEVIRIRPIEEPQGTTGDVRLWIELVRVHYTHDKGSP